MEERDRSKDCKGKIGKKKSSIYSCLTKVLPTQGASVRYKHPVTQGIPSAEREDQVLSCRMKTADSNPFLV